MWTVLLVLFITPALAEKVCTGFGYNWAAEIRCLRQSLRECQPKNQRETRNLDARTSDLEQRSEYQRGRYSSRLLTPPSMGLPTPTPARQEIKQQTTFDSSVLTRNLTSMMDQRLSTQNQRLENQFTRKLHDIKLSLETLLRDVELKTDRDLKEHIRKSDTEMKKLSKRVDLVTARVYDFRGSSYIYMHDRLSWYGAEETCVTWGGHLVSIHSDEENIFIDSLISSQDAAWIGMNDIQLENVYVHTDGTIMNYKNWLPGQPDNGATNENCVEMTKGGYWGDQLCLVTRPFVCKR